MIRRGDKDILPVREPPLEGRERFGVNKFPDCLWCHFSTLPTEAGFVKPTGIFSTTNGTAGTNEGGRVVRRALGGRWFLCSSSSARLLTDVPRSVGKWGTDPHSGPQKKKRENLTPKCSPVNRDGMNRTQVEAAIQSGNPFVIRTADGREYAVQTADHIFVSPKGTFVQIVDDEERITSIPLLTMTAVEYDPVAKRREPA